MHVGCGDGDVLKRGRPEFSDIFWSVSRFVDATVRRFVGGYAGIEETAALFVVAARKLAPFESDASAEGPSPVAVKTAASRA